jgi:hypothetical protein
MSRRTKAQRVARQIAAIPPSTRAMIRFNAQMSKLAAQMERVLMPVIERVAQELERVTPILREQLDRYKKQKEG